MWKLQFSHLASIWNTARYLEGRGVEPRRSWCWKILRFKTYVYKVLKRDKVLATTFSYFWNLIFQTYTILIDRILLHMKEKWLNKSMQLLFWLNIRRVGFSYSLLLFTKIQKLKENTIRIKYYELRMEQSDGRTSGDDSNSGADLQLTLFPRFPPP